MPQGCSGEMIFFSYFILNCFRERDITNYGFPSGIKASNDLFYENKSLEAMIPGESLLEDREQTGVRARLELAHA